MHYTGQIYRPPMESDTPLLEITTGCSHNRCAFCTIYNRTPFSASKLDDIKADLIEMRNTLGSDVRRIYLLNEREMLEEELLLLKSLKVDDDCFFFNSHLHNSIPVIANFSEKNQMIAYM